MISLTNPTGRNTKAHVVTIGDREYFFSYQTCIGYRGPIPGVKVDGFGGIRIANSWGPTTGRHFRELGCADFPTLTSEEFECIVEGSLS